MTDERLRQAASSIEPWIIETRRALHRIPEPGFAEFKTQQLIMRTLDALGISYKAERTWVIGLIEGAHDGPTIALRADIDALPVTEPEGDFSSTHPGFMHACGHDAHTAMLLGAARILSDMKDELHGNVKLLFQPAEESEGGAQPMIAAGALKDPDVFRVYGIHIQPYMPTGMIETRAGALNASTDTLHITVRGKSTHGAYPDHGTDAVLTAAQIISALQTIVSRNISPLESAVVSIGSIHGGTAPNIICGEVQMCGTLRATDAAVRTRLKRRVTELAEHTALAMGCTAQVDIEEGYIPLVNHTMPAERILSVGARLLGEQNVLRKSSPSMGGEDFAYFVEEVPGAFYHVGCLLPGATEYTPLHSPSFWLDENCLRIGALMQAALVFDALPA